MGEVSSQRELFEFEAPTSNLVPVLPLNFYREGSGPDRTRGRGAPIGKRLWWAAIANLPADSRESKATLTTTLRHLNGWLYPDKRWRSRNLDSLRRGLLEASSVRVVWERREWAIVTAKAYPTSATKPDDLLPIQVELPPGSNRGAMIALEMMYQCGTVSGPVFDAAIRLAYLWDAAKAKNGGHRIYATRPKVLRDDRGRLTDVTGIVLTGPDPSLPPSERRKVPADRPVTKWNDSRAVHVGTERNPAADHVPELDRRDLLRLFYGPEIPTGPAREALKQARRMLREHFERPGFVVLEERSRGQRFEAIRILQSRSADE